MVEYYNESVDSILKDLNSSKIGLTNKEAKIRQKEYGINELKKTKKKSRTKQFLNQFNNFIIWILIGATIISYVIGEKVDAIIIFVIIFFNAIFGFIQEFKAEKSIEALKKLSSLKSIVLRNGNQIEINSKDLVVGDILFIESGTKVPADCRIIEEHELLVQESSLTGESTPVSKTSKKLNGVKQLSEQKNIVFSSTIIVKGLAKCIVTKIGMDSEIGKIATQIQKNNKELTPLQKNLDTLGKKLGILTIIICFIIFSATFISFINHETMSKALFESFMVSIALAVAAIPEGLPAVVTISLALGVRNMVKKHALVRKMSSVETLGSTNIICSDKTGTLTKNEMTVKKIFCNNMILDIEGEGYNPKGNLLYKNKKINPKLFEQLFKIGILCNNSKLKFKNNKWKIIGDPTEGSLLVSAIKGKLNINSFIKSNPRIDMIPFSSESKKMVSINQNANKKTAYIKGAPENIINKCSKIYINGRIKPLSNSMKKKIMETNSLFTKEALRVLAFCYKPLKTRYTEKDLIFVGLQGMIDPPRPEVKKDIKLCHKAGIRVIMITGDNINTAIAIAKKIGIKGKSMSGKDLDNISDKEFNKLIEHVSVYARVNPEHKIKIVKALQDKGNIVAMTGDGVNDAPALKKADIGIAMGLTGTDVAKEASDMILMDDNFSSIVKAIENGRGIYDNIRKFINYLLSSNLAEILVIFFATIFRWPLPLIAIHLLWLNLITDGLPAIALGIDKSSSNIMKRKPRNSKENIINKPLGISIIVVGILITIFTLILFKINISNVNKAQTIAFTSLVIFEIIRLEAIRSNYGNSLFSNKYLIMAITSSIILQLIVIYTPLNVFFKTIPLSFKDWIEIGTTTLLLFASFKLVNYITKKSSIIVPKIFIKKYH